MKHSHIFIRVFVSIGISASLLTFSCKTGESINAVKVSVEEVPKREDTDTRDSYVIFRISAEEAVTDYHLAVEESSKAAPTAEEMASGALKRNLGTEPINVLIAQRLNAPMVAFAKKFFADNTHQTLGTGMTGQDWYADMGIILDDQATGSDAWVSESVLKPSTGYTLYGMEEAGSTVTNLLTLTTDSSSPTAAVIDTSEHADTTLEEGHVELAMHADEYNIFPLQRKIDLAAPYELYSLSVGYSNKVSAPSLILETTLGIDVGTLDPGQAGQLLLFDQKATNAETLTSGLYILMQTNMLNDPPDGLYNFETWCSTTKNLADQTKFPLSYAVLRIQG